MHSKNIKTAGKSLKEADKVLIMVHGRGGRAEDILSLASHLNVKDYALLAPQASNNTWYPYSFMAKAEDNQPWLSSALELLKEIVDEVLGHGIGTGNIYFIGFSQGACLTLEFVAQNPTRFGGVVAFTGGLIGHELQKEKYSGDFQKTPFFISTGNPDPHVKLERVEESMEILERMNAEVELEVYENRPHTISQDEIDQANEFIFKK